MPQATSNTSNQYLVHHQGETQGPFGVEFIEAMIMSGVYPSSVIVENTYTSKRCQFSSIAGVKQRAVPPARPAPPSAPSRRPRARAAAKSGLQAMTVFYIIAGIVGCIVLSWIISIVSPTTSEKNETAKASTSKESYSTKKTTLSSKPSQKPRKSSNYTASRTKTTPPQARPYIRSNDAVLTPPPNTRLYRDASGRTYRVPDSAYYRLRSMKSALSAKGYRVDSEKKQLRSLASSVDRDRITLDRTSQYQIDAFNSKVRRVNLMNSSVQSLVDDYNRDVNSFNRELERVGTPIR